MKIYNTFPTPHAKEYRAKRAELRKKYREDLVGLNKNPTFWEGILSKLSGSLEERLEKQFNADLLALQQKQKKEHIQTRMKGYEAAAMAIFKREVHKIVQKKPDLTREELYAIVNKSGKGRPPIIPRQDGYPLWVNRSMRKGKSL